MTTISPAAPRGCPTDGSLRHGGEAQRSGCGVERCGSAPGLLSVCVSGWGSGVGAGAPPHRDVTPSRGSSPHPATSATGCWCCLGAVAAGCLHCLPARRDCLSPVSMSGGAEGAAPLPQLNAVSTGHCHYHGGDSWASGCPHCHSAGQGGRTALWPAVLVPGQWSVPVTAENPLGDANTGTCKGDRDVTAGVGHLQLCGTLGTVSISSYRGLGVLKGAKSTASAGQCHHAWYRECWGQRAVGVVVLVLGVPEGAGNLLVWDA